MITSSQRLNKHAFGMIDLLVIQYALGTIANLYVQLPAHADMSLGFAHGGWLIWAHIILGTIIAIGMISLYIRAVGAKNRIWKIAGGIGALAVVLAWSFGDDFFTTQNDADSLAMSLFFIIALVILGWGAYKAKESRACPTEEDQGSRAASA